ncbi:uncharacterized protein LOC108471390 [Gossypium arboreum]|uniref:uncharacterized protein LOC108471390 n=1 Tax=Gossypium arboreum TaxID=29729 RepID=UPI00081972EE|nr:uncharacterized protein LOC108471390 [Gossypium arboreum]
MSSTEEGGGTVGAVFTDQAIIDNNTNNDYVRIDIFQEVFQAESISIGPLHHDDPTLHESKELKLKLAAHFVKNIYVDKDSLYSNMKKEIDDLKKCYDPQELEKYSDDDEKLTWMFFVDGCAILQAVHMRYGDGDGDGDGDDDMFNDMFLLENQIPFRVLELLTSLGDGKMFMNAIRRFIDGTVINPGEDSFNHIFFFGNLRLPPITVNDSTMNLIAYEMCLDFKNDFTVTSYMCFLDLLIDNAEDVKDLRDASILYNRLGSDEEVAKLFNKMNTDLVPNPMIYREVKRFFFVGKLRLPPITVDDSTMNLIAYQMCPDFYNNFAVTSYMGFLSSLIDEAEDVKELRDTGILYNRLGSDKEVTKLIKKMNIDLVPSPMIYRHVKLQIHNHRNNMLIKYPAQVYCTFFRARWTFFAFVGAIAALFIGALQAFYTIHQAK